MALGFGAVGARFGGGRARRRRGRGGLRLGGQTRPSRAASGQPGDRRLQQRGARARRRPEFGLGLPCRRRTRSSSGCRRDVVCRPCRSESPASAAMRRCCGAALLIALPGVEDVDGDAGRCNGLGLGELVSAVPISALTNDFTVAGLTTTTLPARCRAETVGRDRLADDVVRATGSASAGPGRAGSGSESMYSDDRMALEQVLQLDRVEQHAGRGELAERGGEEVPLALRCGRGRRSRRGSVALPDERERLHALMSVAVDSQLVPVEPAASSGSSSTAWHMLTVTPPMALLMR